MSGCYTWKLTKEVYLWQTWYHFDFLQTEDSTGDMGRGRGRGRGRGGRGRGRGYHQQNNNQHHQNHHQHYQNSSHHSNRSSTHPVGTPPSGHSVKIEQPSGHPVKIEQQQEEATQSQPLTAANKQPPGPRMPDGTRGFTMGRGKPQTLTPRVSESEPWTMNSKPTDREMRLMGCCLPCWYICWETCLLEVCPRRLLSNLWEPLHFCMCCVYFQNQQTLVFD